MKEIQKIKEKQGNNAKKGEEQKQTQNNGETNIGGVPSIPDPNASSEVSRCKLEVHRDASWWCIYFILPAHQNRKIVIAAIFHLEFAESSRYL